VREALARALARHLDEAQLGKAVHGHPLRSRASACGTRSTPRCDAPRVHVDEVDDDDAAEIPQPQLARDHLRSLEIRFENRVVKLRPPTNPPVFTSTVVSGFGLVDDQVAAGLSSRRAPSAFSFRPRRCTSRISAARPHNAETRSDVRHELARERLDFLETFRVNRSGWRGFLVGEIAHHRWERLRSW